MQCDFDDDDVKLPNNLSLLTVFQQWLGLPNQELINETDTR
ncbi:hypothetical protein ACGH6R_08625 [Gilliamella sp. CG13]